MALSALCYAHASSVKKCHCSVDVYCCAQCLPRWVHGHNFLSEVDTRYSVTVLWMSTAVHNACRDGYMDTTSSVRWILGTVSLFCGCLLLCAMLAEMGTWTQLPQWGGYLVQRHCSMDVYCCAQCLPRWVYNHCLWFVIYPIKHYHSYYT